MRGRWEYLTASKCRFSKPDKRCRIHFIFTSTWLVGKQKQVTEWPRSWLQDRGNAANTGPDADFGSRLGIAGCETMCTWFYEINEYCLYLNLCFSSPVCCSIHLRFLTIFKPVFKASRSGFVCGRSSLFFLTLFYDTGWLTIHFRSAPSLLTITIQC